MVWNDGSEMMIDWQHLCLLEIMIVMLMVVIVLMLIIGIMVIVNHDDKMMILGITSMMMI